MPRNTKRKKIRGGGGTKRARDSEFSEPSVSEPVLPPYLKILEQHILNTPLDLVESSYWMKNKINDVDIFLIGEQHGEKNGKCTGILDMFNSLIFYIRDLKRKSRSPFPLINIMLESNPHEFTEVTHGPAPDQLTSVIRTIPSKAKIIKVQWFDVNRSNQYEHYYPEETCDIKKSCVSSKTLPSWINNLQMAGFNYNKIEEHEHFFTPYINIPPRYAQITDPIASSWTNIIHKHCIIKKELCKIKKITYDYVDPRKIFNINYILKKFNEKIISTSNIYNSSLTSGVLPHEHPLSIVLRHAIDFYCVARIISQKMNCVVIYGGHEHILFIIEILKDMGYNVFKNSNYDCKDYKKKRMEEETDETETSDRGSDTRVDSHMVDTEGGLSVTSSGLD